MVSSVETVLQIKKKRKKERKPFPPTSCINPLRNPRALKHPPHRLPEMSSLVSRKRRAVPSPWQGSRVPAFAWTQVPPRHRSRPLDMGQIPSKWWHMGMRAGEPAGSRDREVGFVSCVTTVVDGEGSAGSLDRGRPITALG